jgi:hypothetical protein
MTKDASSENVPTTPEAFLKTFFPYNPNTKKLNSGRSGINAIIMALGIVRIFL